MKILVEIDLETNTSRIVSRDDLTIQGLTYFICKYFNITEEELYIRSKESKYYVPRQFYIYYSKTLFSTNNSEIARQLHYSAHGTVLKHWNNINIYLEQHDSKYITHKNNLDNLLGITK